MKAVQFGSVLLLISLGCKAQNNKIVFVCEHGAVKSVLAAAYFNKIAQEKNLSWSAICRGTNPDEKIPAETKRILSADHILDDKLQPQKLLQNDVDNADQVILFCSLPADIQGKSNDLNWSEVKTVNYDYKKLRDDIVSKLNTLIDSLSKQ